MSFEIKIDKNDLYGFTLYYTYSGIMGKLWVIFSIICLVGAYITYGQVNIQGTVALIVLGLLFTVIQPLLLYQKCCQRVKKTDAFNNSFIYTIKKNGFSISQGDIVQKVRWDEIFKIVATKKAVYFCITPSHAQIIPLDQLNGKAEEFKAFLKNEVTDEVMKKGL